MTHCICQLVLCLQARWQGEVMVRVLSFHQCVWEQEGVSSGPESPQSGGAPFPSKGKALALAQAGNEAPSLQAGPCPSGFDTFILRPKQVYLFF